MLTQEEIYERVSATLVEALSVDKEETRRYFHEGRRRRIRTRPVPDR